MFLFVIYYSLHWNNKNNNNPLCVIIICQRPKSMKVQRHVVINLEFAKFGFGLKFGLKWVLFEEILVEHLSNQFGSRTIFWLWLEKGFKYCKPRLLKINLHIILLLGQFTMKQDEWNFFFSLACFYFTIVVANELIVSYSLEKLRSFAL